MAQETSISEANKEASEQGPTNGTIDDSGKDSAFDIVNTKPTYHDLKKMKQIHHEIALYAVLGYQPGQIAKKLEVTVAMVRYTLNSTLVKRKLAILRAERDKEALDITARLKELAPLALDELENMLLHPNTNETNRKNIAQDLLDRSGHGAVKKVADVSEHLTTDDINEIKEIARENGMVSKMNDAEDAEFEDITTPDPDKVKENDEA